MVKAIDQPACWDVAVSTGGASIGRNKRGGKAAKQMREIIRQQGLEGALAEARRWLLNGQRLAVSASGTLRREIRRVKKKLSEPELLAHLRSTPGDPDPERQALRELLGKRVRRRLTDATFSDCQREFENSDAELQHVLAEILEEKRAVFKREISKCRIRELKERLAETSEAWQKEVIQGRIEALRAARKERKRQSEARRLMSPREVFDGSDAAATRALRRRLECRGVLGSFAWQLFKAQKASTRAKAYVGGIDVGGSTVRYADLSYQRKNEALRELCEALAAHDLGVVWGWGQDPKQSTHNHVLYVELPTGQASFHSAHRMEGPEYPFAWDGTRKSVDRILEFCEQVLAQEGTSAAQDSG